MASYINSLVKSSPYRAFPTTHLYPEPTSTPLRDVPILLLKMLFIALLHSGIRSMRVSRSIARVTCSVQCPPLTNRTSNPTIRIFHCVFRDLISSRFHYPLKSLSLFAFPFSPLFHSLRTDANFDIKSRRRLHTEMYACITSSRDL